MTSYQYSGSGFLSQTSNVVENKTYSYNKSSQFGNTEDFGSILNFVDLLDDQGQVSELSGPTVDYGFLSQSVSGIITPFGGISLGGSAITSANYRLFFSGQATEKVIYSPDDTTGTLFGFGVKSEKRTFNYNESSLENTEEDFGFVNQVAPQSEDYQSILDPSGITEEYGLITGTTGGIITPFGGISLGGSAITSANYRLFFSGQATEKVIYSPDDTTGTLFGFGEKLESVTYNYNQSSTYANSDDYGLVSTSNPEISDYGIISQIGGSQPEENYGLITESVLIGLIDPFGSLSLSGSALVSEIATYTKIASGTIFVSGTGLESTRISLENTQLFQINGSSLDSSINAYVASGTLFGFGEKLESVTYDYNESAGTGSSDNYGLISNAHSTTEDFGFINSIVDDGIDNYGRIGGEVGTTPFGSILFSGSSNESFEKGLYSASGSININGSIIEKFVASSDTTQLFQINGSALDSSINDYVASGTLFGFGEKLESVTYDYSEVSIYENTDDYGLISTPNPQIVDYDSITQLVGNQPEDNYGLIVDTIQVSTLTPFGTLSLSGSLVESETDSYVGSGSLNISGELIPPNIDYTPVYPSGGVITISGSALDSSINDYVASGTLFGFGEKLESVTYDYNESSIVVYDSSDYGYIYGPINVPNGSSTNVTFDSNSVTFDSYQSPGASTISEYDDYGLIIDSATVLDYGFIVELTGIYPFGSITLSGSLVESETDSYVGLGTFFVSGVLLQQETSSYVGSGSITLSGSLVESETDSYVGLGTVFVSDLALESEVDSYIASGSISLSGTALEAYSAQTPEDTQLFVISGSLIESESDSYVGTGSITLSGSLIESETDSYVGLGTIFVSDSGLESEIDSYIASGSISLSGTALEAYSAQTPEDTQLFVISDVGVRYYSPIYPRNALIGDSGSGIGTIRLNDDNQLTITRAVLPYFAKGQITLSNGASESFGKGLYTAVGIVTVSGISSNREIANYGYYGDDKDPGTSGKITISSQTEPTVEKFIKSEVGVGTITLSSEVGFKILRRTNSFKGSGSITISGIGNDSFAVPISNTVLFNFSGIGAESFTPQGEIGSGLITISGPPDPSYRIFAYLGSGQIDIGGNAEVKRVISREGQGSINIVPRVRVDNDYITCDLDHGIDASLSIACDKEDDGLVKFIANPPENTILFTIGGEGLTSTTNLYQYVGIGNISISGNYVDLKATFAEVGFGTVTLSKESIDTEVDSYIGLGTILSASGAVEVLSSQTPENTVLVQIGGTASTKVEFEYVHTGIGTVYLSGFSSERVIYQDLGFGLITLSGSLVDPNIKFVPSPDGFGIINVVGNGQEKVRYVDSIQGGSLFTISGGFESFSKTNYIGIGTIFIVGAASSIVNNPFQPGRLYVTII